VRINSIVIKNYRPFRLLEETCIGNLTTLVGRNDSGKSSILRALKLFFNDKAKVEEDDIHDGARDEDVVIEITFSSLPDEIEFEDGVLTTFKEEMLLDKNDLLRIRKIFLNKELGKPKNLLITQDFQDSFYSGLINLKESSLNSKCKDKGLDFSRSGRGITNKEKREALRNYARDNNVSIEEVKFEPNTKIWKIIKSLFPEFDLFETETKTAIGEASFQSHFRPIVKNAAEDRNVAEAKEHFKGAIKTALQREVDKIFTIFKRHTNDLSQLSVMPVFLWEKAVNFSICGLDHYGINKPLEKRGSGMRRLLMVSFFQYLVEKREEEPSKFVFGIEEPETNLHPGLQRELLCSLQDLSDLGYQIILTSHSPVFAGGTPKEDLTLIKREGPIAKAFRIPELDMFQVAEELGIEPSDQITGYDACIFVEGIGDINFWKKIARTLKEAGYIPQTFEDTNIGFIPYGGANLKSWISIRAMRRINRKFCVIMDSDKKNSEQKVCQRKINWKKEFEKEGGVCFILRKREIENYIHPNAIIKSGSDYQEYDDFTDMKKLFGLNVIKKVEFMEADEILEMDKYIEKDGTERHELLEIIKTVINFHSTKKRETTKIKPEKRKKELNRKKRTKEVQQKLFYSKN